VLYQVDRLAHGQDEQELPQVVAILEPGEQAALGPVVEAVEGAQHDILLVGHGPGSIPQPDAGQRDQPLEVGVPRG
jgi:hypothetical protein